MTASPAPGVPAVVVTVSDRAATGERADLSGPAAVEILGAKGYVAAVVMVPDGAAEVADAIRSAVAGGARLVVTSGEGGSFPKGIPVGQVVEVQQNDVEMFQRAIVRTTVDFDTLETVLVITSFTPVENLENLPEE